MKKVLIMLSTYNGELFLREQLDSLYAQEGVDLHILIRDDGSKDNTLGILKEYQRKNAKMTVVPAANVGAAKSFHLLAHYAITEMPEYDYFAFCDQDDVWLNDKLMASCKALDESNAKYKLYYGPATLVDGSLNALDTPCAKIVNTLEANIFASRSLGCTQVFNKALLERFVQLHDYVINAKAGEFVPLHDGWMALIAYALGADVIVGNEPHMLYRQHGHNVVGANENFLKRTSRRFRRFFSGACPKSSKCRLVLNIMGHEIPNANRKTLELCTNYKKSITSRIRLASYRKLYQYSAIDNFGLFATIITGTF